MKLAGMYKAGNRSSLQKSTNDLLARMTGQDKSSAADVTPSFGTPGAAHAGQGGSNYQDEEPDQSDAETARLARSGTADMPNDRRMNDADYINSLNPDMPKGQGGYDYSDEYGNEAEPNDRKMNDANYINSLNPNGAKKPPRDLGLPPGELDKNSWDDMMKSVPGLDNDAWADLMKQTKVSEADAPAQNRAAGFTDPYFQSRQLPGGKWWGSVPSAPAPAPAKTPSADVTKDPLFRAAMNRIDADNNAKSQMGSTVPLSDLQKAPSLPSNRVTPVDATDTFESREGDALLARIKSLALIK